MKTAFLFFFGLIAILSAFYLINPTELQLSSFNQVFAQSEDKNKNFDDATTIHSSETITSEKTSINKNLEKNNNPYPAQNPRLLSKSGRTISK